MKIILASASPRRRELLKNITDDFTVRVSDADESTVGGLSPEQTVRALAELKADAVYAGNEEEIIIAADTVVAADGQILGKPRDEADAFAMLKMLSGKTHEVFTGVCIRTPAAQTVFSERTEVEFYPLSDDEITAYIKTGEPSDKAGAYGIQGKGCLLVKRINGDYFNVVGLPVAALSRELKKLL